MFVKAPLFKVVVKECLGLLDQGGFYDVGVIIKKERCLKGV